MSNTVTEPPLAGVLAAILPHADQTWLLRACLHRRAAAHAAWQNWQHTWDGNGRTAMPARHDVKVLSPLILEAVRREQFELHPAEIDRLRAARLREELRWDAYRRICRQALAVLAQAGVPTIVLKGAALAETVWCHESLRHCHDLDLLIPPDAGDHAGSALIAAGFQWHVDRAGRHSGDIRLSHADGLPVVLHQRLDRLDYYPSEFAPLWARGETQTVAGVECRLLSAVDALSHVCVHASSCRSGASLNWACDSWFLLDRYTDLNWNALVALSERRRTALPLYITLHYLAEQLKAPIPAHVIRELRNAAMKADAADQSAAVAGARDGAGIRRLLQIAKSPREQFLLARFLLFPSASYLRRTRQVPSNWPVIPYYFVRPIEYLLKRMRRRWSE